MLAIRPFTLALAGWLIALASGAPVSAAPIFLPLPQNFRAEDVSARGTVVVGAVGSTAYRWTPTDGLVALGSAPGPGGVSGAVASAVSADGSVIVGWGPSQRDGASGVEPFRWTPAGMVGLGYLDVLLNRYEGFAFDISADGSVVVGRGQGFGGMHGFRWTLSTGLIDLGLLGPDGTEASGVSADGSLMAGSRVSSSESFVGYKEALRGTATEGMQGLGFLPGGVASRATAISWDGSAVVGTATLGSPQSGFVTQAMRWTPTEGMVSLGDLPGGSSNSIAQDVHPNGWFVVGHGNTAAGQRAFIWDPSTGMRELWQVLSGLGLDLTGWRLESAVAISDDGLGRDDSMTIVGNGRDPSGALVSWIAQIPEPSSLGSAALGLCGIAVLRRRMSMRPAPRTEREVESAISAAC